MLCIMSLSNKCRRAGDNCNKPHSNAAMSICDTKMCILPYYVSYAFTRYSNKGPVSHIAAFVFFFTYVVLTFDLMVGDETPFGFSKNRQ